MRDITGEQRFLHYLSVLTISDYHLLLNKRRVRLSGKRLEVIL